MICVVLHCDQADCGCEQGYPINTLEQHQTDNESLPVTALRLGAMYGWRQEGEGIDALILCPQHSGGFGG